MSYDLISMSHNSYEPQLKSAEFMKAAGQEVKTQPVSTAPNKVKELRLKLVLEEALELAEALGINLKHKFANSNLNSQNFSEQLEVESTDHFDIVEVADALTDLLYVIYGAGNAFGIDLSKTFEEVHRSNMSKFIDGHKHPVTGKWIKGPSYSPANLKKLL